MSKMLMRQFLQSGDPWKSRVGDSCLDLWAVQGSQEWELKADADFRLPSRRSKLKLIFRLPSRLAPIRLETVVRRHDMFENRPVTQSSRHAQIGEEGNMATSLCRLQITVEIIGF